MKKYFLYLFICAVTLTMLIFPEKTIQYAKQGLNICFEIIIPSLFPFFVCSGLLIYSGFARILSDVCRPVMRPLFNINACGAAAFVLGLISGYPLGAVTACQLYESGYLSKTEAERLLAFCNNSGPLFILGAVGSAIYASRKIGLILYIAHILAALSVGILLRFYKQDKHTAPHYRLNRNENSISEIFSQVLNNSVSSILTVCASIVFFSVISNIIADLFPAESIIRALILGILEISGGNYGIGVLDAPIFLRVILSAFSVGFAGICVHMQVMAIVSKQRLSLLPYIIGKLLHGLFSAAYTWVLLKFISIDDAVFRSCYAPLSAGFCTSSIYSSVSVIFICLIAILLIAVSGGILKKIKEKKCG